MLKENIVKEFEKMEKKITSLQKKLKEFSSSNSLLGLVKIDWMGMHYTGDFGARYYGKSVYDGFKNYIVDLEVEIKKYNNINNIKGG